MSDATTPEKPGQDQIKIAVAVARSEILSALHKLQAETGLSIEQISVTWQHRIGAELVWPRPFKEPDRHFITNIDLNVTL